jgi:FlaA1/EpsC-like NDP-sugar epimerase
VRLAWLPNRRWLADALHVAVAAAALWSSFMLRLEFTLDPLYRHMLLVSLTVLVPVKLAVFRGFALREQAWRYVGFSDQVRMAWANVAASAAATVALRVMVGSAFPRSIYVLDCLVCLILMLTGRGIIRLLLERRPARRERTRAVLIYGAGSAGVQVLGEIRANPRIGMHVAGFIDDDPRKRGLRIHGVRVLGHGKDLPALARQHRAEQVLIAVASATGAQITTILERCHRARIAAKRVPALGELTSARVLVDQIREVRLEDLLGRAPVRLEDDGIRARLRGRVVLVTGAGGSIGGELCRQIARFHPAALVGFDQAETALYEIEQEMREQFPGLAFYPEIGSIQSRARLSELFERHRPESVYHAAAYKHVPMMEAHLLEAVENNVFGTRTLARAAVESGVEDFVLVSSDKAVRPSSVMGATKRLAELVCLAAGEGSPTEFIAVRFGNVLGSNGSVIPKFRRQIAAGGPVTVTHPEMRRFFMTIPEAAQLVLEAAAMGKTGAGGEIFVLEMGEPLKIVDLARKMVLLSGLRPDVDIRIEFSGIRPGEKLLEELSGAEEDTVATRHPQIRIYAGRPVARDGIERRIERLQRHVENRDAEAVLRSFEELVPDYHPSSFVLRRIRRAASVVA